MDSVEFVKNIENNAGLFIHYFDSTMALYDLIHEFKGLRLINNCSEAEIRFTAIGDQHNLESIIEYINTYRITGYGGTYLCNAHMEGDKLIIILTQVM